MFASLPVMDRTKLRKHIQVFCAEKRFEGCRGLVITDEVRVVIAAFACLLILHKKSLYYPRVSSILVYPGSYKVARPYEEGGITTEDLVTLDGESWSKDYVILSWDAVLSGARSVNGGDNVVIHEFAHQLDLEDGCFDGTPRLPNRKVLERWREVFESEYQLLSAAADDDKVTVLDHYGAQDRAEFFAVATEAFFSRARDLKEKHRSLYALLSVYYELDLLKVGPSFHLPRDEWPPELLCDSRFTGVIKRSGVDWTMLTVALFPACITLIVGTSVVFWGPRFGFYVAVGFSLVYSVGRTIWEFMEDKRDAKLFDP